MTNNYYGDRGSGRTTRQIKDAPQGAVYVVPHSAVDYTRRLAESLGRADLRIERPDYFFDKWHGLQLPVVVDHAAPEFMSTREREGWIGCAAYLSAHDISIT